MIQRDKYVSVIFGLTNKLVFILFVLVCNSCKTAKINMTSNYLQYSIVIPPGTETEFYTYERQKRQNYYNLDDPMNMFIDNGVITICRDCINFSPEISNRDSVKLYLMKNNEIFRYKILRKSDGFYYYANYFGLEHNYKLYWTDTLSHPRLDLENPLNKPENTNSFTKYTGRDTVIWTNGVRFNCSIIYEYVVKNSISYPKRWFIYIDKRTGLPVMVRRYEPINGVEIPIVFVLTDFNGIK